MECSSLTEPRDFYRAFEDRYRGSRELITSRLRVYLPFLEPLKEIYPDCRAVDLGCGRGEWLELMRDSGIDAHGIDLDDGMLAACRERGLSVEQRDAIEYLQSLPAASVAIVSAFHVVEHIPFDALQMLTEEALRVLVPAGLLILETPNPENLSVGACKFYYDPTHQRPIPPPLLSFLPEHYGFARTKILRLQEQPRLAEAIDVGLNDVLAGVSPDYAVIAQKGSVSAEDLARFDATFSKEFGVDLETLAMRYDAHVGSTLSEILARVDRAAAVEAKAQADIAARDAEIARLHAHNAARDAEIERLHAHNAARDAEIKRLHAHIAWQDANLEDVKVEVSQGQAQLDAVYTSTSWRMTAPVRALGRLAHKSSGLAAAAKLRLKVALKPAFVRVGGHLAARPRLRAGALRVMRPFPRFRARLARAAGLVSPAIDTVGGKERPQITLEQLGMSARQVYRDLVGARDAKRKANREL